MFNAVCALNNENALFVLSVQNLDDRGSSQFPSCLIELN